MALSRINSSGRRAEFVDERAARAKAGQPMGGVASRANWRRPQAPPLSGRQLDGEKRTTEKRGWKSSCGLADRFSDDHAKGESVLDFQGLDHSAAFRVHKRE